MKIYVSHSTAFDYQYELYNPIREFTKNATHEFYLPHEKSHLPHDTKSVIKNSDLILAEVSFPSTGQGIELGWANIFEIPIIGIYKTSQIASSSLEIILTQQHKYSSPASIKSILSKFII